MAIAKYLPREAPATQARPATIKDLTLGQVVSLLQVHGGAAALLIAAALTEDATPPLARARPEDQCSLAILGLAYATRDGMRLTGKGTAWSQQILGA